MPVIRASCSRLFTRVNDGNSLATFPQDVYEPVTYAKDYSYLKATIGSTRVARAAGIRLAMTVTTNISAASLRHTKLMRQGVGVPT